MGPGVTEVAVGDRVAYAGLPGSYAEVRIAPAARLVKLPPGIDDKTAAAMMLKGMTAEFLLLRCARVGRGDTILFHAAAGGVGSIACQWAKHLGAARDRHGGRPREGRRSRLRNGCDDVIDYDKEDVVARVKELTGGAGVRRRCSTGSASRRSTPRSACLAMRGMLVLFGQSSGRGPARRAVRAGARGSLFLTRPVVLPLRRRARRAGRRRRRRCSRSCRGAR